MEGRRPGPPWDLPFQLFPLDSVLSRSMLCGQWGMKWMENESGNGGTVVDTEGQQDFASLGTPQLSKVFSCYPTARRFVLPFLKKAWLTTPNI